MTTEVADEDCSKCAVAYTFFWRALIEKRI